MTQFDANTDLTQTAATEAMTLGDLGCGDLEAGQYIAGIQAATGTIARSTGMGRAEHARLLADDVSNPVGVARQLNDLPANMDAMNGGHVDNIGANVEALQTRLMALALRHDSSTDSDTTVEIANYLANAKSNDGTTLMLARTPRYATRMAGNLGASYAAKLGEDHGAYVTSALSAIGVAGTPQAVAAVAALKGMRRATRVHGLSQAGARDASGKIRAANAAKYPADRGYNGPSSPAAIRNEAQIKARR